MTIQMQTQNNERPVSGHKEKVLSRVAYVRSKLSTWVLLAVLLGVFLVVGAFGYLSRRGGPAGYDTPVYQVEKDLMRVTVSAGGMLQAMRSHDVQSRVEGTTQILEIIPEGTIISESDVANEIVLMELDASSAREKLEQQKITVQDASASFTQANENYTIQKEQNESDISQARLRVRFALMELKRYLGDEMAERAIAGELDFESEGWQDGIGGASLQARRRLENDVSLATEELSRTQESLHWTRELVERGYVNRNELVADELEEKRRTVQLDSAQEELALFLRYSLVKEAEERLSDYIESKRNLERTEARARGRMAQAEADLRSRQASFRLQEERLERLHQMIENSTVKATRPGMVVYASTTDPRQFRNSPVQAGLSVREGQTIISMPDLSTLAARVEVPETMAQMVRPGQVAAITIDAIPDRSWTGEVRRVSPMATQQTGFRALTGGSSGYETDVAFQGVENSDNELKPGMSATVEIEVARIPEALSVPIHAVHTRDGRRMCWVAGTGGSPELREVDLGFYTDTHVQIRRGLAEGEIVFLTQPEVRQRDVEIVLLPDRVEEMEDDIDPESFLTGDSILEAGDQVTDSERQIEEWLASLDPATAARIRERLADPENRQRILEQLQDPEARRQMEARMQGGDSRRGEGGRGGEGGGGRR